MSGNLTLYYLPESGPCRTVLLAAKVLGIELKLKTIDLFAGEHMKPDFLKINPAHNVPALTDGDFCLNESRAIIIYLAEKYGKTDSLYPKDPQKRARVNQKLFFDMAPLYQTILDYYACVYFGAKDFDESKMPRIKQAVVLLNTFLEKSKYAAGDCLTLADIAIVSTIGTAISVFDFDLKPYPNIEKWYANLKSTLPDFKGIIEENGQKLRVMADSFKAKNRK